MKLHLNRQPDTLLIHSWAFGPEQDSEQRSDNDAPNGDNGAPNDDNDRYRIRIADTWYRQSLILTSRSVKLWAVADVSALELHHFEQLAELGAELDAEVIILGAGKRTVFPRPAVTRPLMRRRIGLEVMDTAAACRTYNILAGDGRVAVAALIL